MNEEERKLMISMALAIDANSAAIKHIVGQLTHKPTETPVVAAPVSNIEHEQDGALLKVDVQFKNAGVLSREDRMKKSGELTESLQTLCNNYQVNNFRATYGSFWA